MMISSELIFNEVLENSAGKILCTTNTKHIVALYDDDEFNDNLLDTLSYQDLDKFSATNPVIFIPKTQWVRLQNLITNSYDLVKKENK